MANGKAKPLVNGRKPKIAIIHYSAPPTISGVDVVIRDQARMFRSFGYKVDIIAGLGRQFRKDIPVRIIQRINPRHPKVQAVRANLEKGIVTTSFYQLERSLYTTVRHYIMEQGIDVCIVHNLMIRHYNLPLTSALLSLAHDMPRVRFIAWVHDTLFSDQPAFAMDNQAISAYPWTLLTQPDTAITYVCINEYCKKNLLRMFDGKAPQSIHVITNAIDIPKFLGLSPMMRRFYDAIDGLGSDLIALVPVRAVPRKNLELAIAIAREMVLKGVNMRLLLTANVDYKRPEYMAYYQELKELVGDFHLEKHVIFMEEHFRAYTAEFVPTIPMSEAYRISDFLLLTCVADGFGLPLLEAGLNRVPIFVGDISPYREIGTTNINYFPLTQTPKTITRFILSRLARMPQAYFYRKVIKQFSLRKVFAEKVIPLIESI